MISKEEEFNNQLKKRDAIINEYIKELDNLKSRISELEEEIKSMSNSYNDSMKLNHNLEDEINRLKTELKKTEDNYHRLGIELEKKFKEKNVMTIKLESIRKYF
jgi:peptidoglycan hydrolase CwlO-like protein